MKKISLLLGALGGGMAGYLFSNKKLREQLANAKDPKKAAKILGEHLSSDGEKLARDVKEFLESEQVQSGVNKAKKYASDQYTTAKKEIERLAGAGASHVKSTAKQAASSAKKQAKKVTSSSRRKIKNKVRKIGK